MVCIMNLGWTCRSPKAPTSSWLVSVSCWLLGVMQRDRGSAGCNGSYDVKAYHGRQSISRTPLSDARWRGAEAPPLVSSSSFYLVRYIHSSIFFVPFATAPHLGNGDQGGDVRVEVTPLPSSSIVFTRVNEVRVDKRVLRGRRVGFPIEEVEERKKERKKERRMRDVLFSVATRKKWRKNDKYWNCCHARRMRNDDRMTANDVKERRPSVSTDRRGIATVRAASRRHGITET